MGDPGKSGPKGSKGHVGAEGVQGGAGLKGDRVRKQQYYTLYNKPFDWSI